ncbi:hypothetical protein NUU61_008630 [Penicillium alfredii]|uniref:UspA domain-containing protein n=1 Tax=Penicillium alfredii TaxID=1506179 RepID=A0A9W9ELM5_9EURO|nr:uncharacterized protein NUU61_008630 [Penicillium alfredii]KAJ5084051.1 hypothetical protein NUU61_008630 [Penicillium alfredii]
MSSHGLSSPISSQIALEDHKTDPGRRSPAHSSSVDANQKPTVTRALQSLLSAPQSEKSAGAGISGATPLRAHAVRSPAEPFQSSPLRTISTMASAPSSPERPKAGVDGASRRSLDIGSGTDRRASVIGIEEDSKSDIGPSSSDHPSAKKRFLQSRDKPQARRGMAAMMSGLESRFFPKSFTRGREPGRGSSQRGSSLDSRSPSSFGRPVSPGSRANTDSEKPTPINSGRGKALQMEDVHNKSDEVLSKPAGNLPDYVKPVAHGDSGERLAKDVFDRDKNIIESSEDEGEETSSDEEHMPGEARGRKKKDSDIRTITPSDFNKPKSDKPTQPEDEQKPSEKPPAGPQEKKPKKSALKAVVHPQTSFDIPTPHNQSATNTPYGSEDEAEVDDIKRAQKLRISMSAIDNLVHNRSIRTIVRGNFTSLQEGADGSRRRRRKYLIATDLSEESVYALEWTIGTVLRDGDTMFAICAVHEDSNISSVQVGEGAKAIQDATAVVGTQTKEATLNSAQPSRNLLGRLGPGTASKSGSVDARASPMAEAERVRAVEAVSNTCVKLLRKTLLQVRIAVEVIHCKNPKLMITEAIDELEPTLVIVGARGQSALKGVLLGSFSNYLLSNSSVPVMVARRKLKRHTSKGRINTNFRLSNNLPTPKSLAQAKVD